MDGFVTLEVIEPWVAGVGGTLCDSPRDAGPWGPVFLDRQRAQVWHRIWGVVRIWEATWAWRENKTSAVTVRTEPRMLCTV